MERYDFPWFPYYPGDWFSSGRVKIMTLQEKGAYHELLLYAWKSDACAIPNDEGILKRLVGWPELEFGIESEHNFQRVMDAFTVHPEQPNMLHNARLYREWLATIARHKNFSQRGKKGAKKRWQIPPSPAAPPAIQKPIKKLQDRASKGLTPIAQEVSAIADKHFPPI